METRNQRAIMVTRPSSQNHFLAKLLFKEGYKVIEEPLLKICSQPRALNLSHVQALIFTSSNAVDPFCSCNPQRDLPVFAVGTATALAAEKNKFGTVFKGDAGVEKLLQTVIKTCVPDKGKIMYLSGEDIRFDVTEALNEFGLNVKREIVYKAEPTKKLSLRGVSAIEEGEVAAIMFYSPRTSAIFAKLAHETEIVGKCRDIKAVCFSPAVAEPVSLLPWQDLIAVNTPQTSTLLDVLRKAVPLS
jgi:uroporphyrinogen-III synthase